jgi:hypothetical protein
MAKLDRATIYLNGESEAVGRKYSRTSRVLSVILWGIINN